ncbi:MAG: peptidoglycan binding domain-containing protein [Lachnospiraceae bacterium]
MTIGKIDSFVENELTPLNCEAQNAILSHEDGVFTVTAQVNGRTVNTEATEQAIEDAIQANNYEGGFTVDAVVDVQQPAVTTEALSAISRMCWQAYTTDISGSENRKSNVRLGASNISGKLLLPGESASASEMMQSARRTTAIRKRPSMPMVSPSMLSAAVSVR